jgi:hypothetical protein
MLKSNPLRLVGPPFKDKNSTNKKFTINNQEDLHYANSTISVIQTYINLKSLHRLKVRLWTFRGKKYHGKMTKVNGNVTR